jgi:hypothetical protein
MPRAPGLLLPSLRLLLCVLAPLGLMGIQCDPGTPGDLPTGEPTDRPDPPAASPPERPAAPAEDPGDSPPPEDPPGHHPTDPPPEHAPPEPPDAPSWTLVPDLYVERVSLYQGVEVPLDGAPGLAPVVAGRDALVRVFVEPLPGFVPRAVRAVLRLEGPEGDASVEEEVRATGRSAQDDLDSTLNVSVPGDLIGPDTAVSVRIVELDDGGDSERGPASGLWPVGGGAVPLHALELGDLTVRIVPLLYAADGSRRAPDTSQHQIARLRTAARTLTPAPDAVVWVDAPVVLPSAVAPDGEGWSDALVLLTDLRETRSVRDDEYVYGLVAPAPTFGGYCGRSCVAGLSWRATDPSAAWARTSLGLGYVGPSTEETFVHELGHAHGRMHAPCGGPASPDPDYPYPDGGLGSQGYDAAMDALVDPDAHGDLMGYCGPRWVSDYTYGALAERMEVLDAMPALLPEPGWPRAVLVIEPSEAGTRLVGQLTLRRPPDGEVRTVEVLDADGDVLNLTEARVQSMEHTGRDVLLVPRPQHRAAAAVRVDGASVALPTP